MKRLLLSFLFLSSLCADKSSEQIFSNIYEVHEWGLAPDGYGSSGTGSIPSNVETYTDFLREFLIEYQIDSVVDVGCGDFEIGKEIDWEGMGITYIGIDVVPKVIERNRAKYASDSITFLCQDIVESALPPADLFICKDVLQHLPNSDIKKVLERLNGYTYSLITNDIAFRGRSPDLNADIPRGRWHLIDLRKPPFNQRAIPLLNFEIGATSRKQTFLLMSPIH